MCGITRILMLYTRLATLQLKTDASGPCPTMTGLLVCFIYAALFAIGTKV